MQATNEELQKTNDKLSETTKALEASRTSFQNVVDKSASGIMVVDENAIIQFLNPAMKKQFCDSHLSIGEEFAIPIAPNKRTEVKITLPNNEIGIAEMDVVKTFWENKPAYLFMLHDITETKKAHIALEIERASLAKRVEERTAELSQANAELAQAARLKDEFLANMSHELRTPLNAIITMSDLLKDGIYGEIAPKQSKPLKHIIESSYHLLSLINDILDLSKIEAGKLELQIETIFVEGVCHSILQIIKQLAIKKQIKILFASDDSVKTIFADQRALKQVLVNLLNNAVKFTPQKGKVTLELQGDEINKVANFHVIDTGIGIPENEIERLFKPFVQIDSSLSRPHEGTGLGLALVYKIVELHGGSVNVESQVGKGSKFTVSLPWQESDKILALSQEKSSKASRVVVDHPAALILLAEDNETNIMAIQTGLTGYGYEVIVARNGLEAIERAQENKPALVLMDIQMPGLDGLEATKQIHAKEQLAKIPIIALTALAMPGDKERCLEAGVNAYLSKPVNVKRLVAEIEKQLSEQDR